MKVCVILSILLLFGFITVSIRRYGLLNSYSAFSTKWLRDVHLSNTDVWGVVTFIAAFLMVPPMITAGEGSGWQFLGFFCPVYLILVGLTPEWESKPLQRKLHCAFAITCALLCFGWIVLVCHCWYVVLAPFLICLALAHRLNRFDALVFWGEMVMFTSAYLTLLIIL